MGIICAVSVCPKTTWWTYSEFRNAPAPARGFHLYAPSLFKPAQPQGATRAYARVSSHDQREQVVTQAERLRRHCDNQGFANVEVITDLGSGMNYRKKGLQRLLGLLLAGNCRTAGARD